MNESEQKEQELERVKVLYICDEVDCDGDTPVIKKTVAVTTAAAAATNGDSNGSSKKMNETGKLRNLFEIENTLNDTCLIDEEKKNGDGDSVSYFKDKFLFLVDTRKKLNLFKKRLV